MRNQKSSKRNRSISSRVGVQTRTLKQYPRTNSRLTAWRKLRHYAHTQQDSQREEELVQLVLNATKQLETQEKRVTQQRIAQMVGLSYQTLRLYPRVEALLIPIASKHPNSKPQSYQVSVQRLLSSTNVLEEKVAE